MGNPGYYLNLLQAHLIHIINYILYQTKFANVHSIIFPAQIDHSPVIL